MAPTLTATFHLGGTLSRKTAKPFTHAWWVRAFDRNKGEWVEKTGFSYSYEEADAASRKFWKPPHMTNCSGEIVTVKVLETA